MAELGVNHYRRIMAQTKLGVESVDASSNSSPAVPRFLKRLVMTRRIKLNQVLSQLNEKEVNIIAKAKHIRLSSMQEVSYGRGARRILQHEPTVEQLSGLKALVETRQTPYEDPAKFQPSGASMMKRIKFAGSVVHKAGFHDGSYGQMCARVDI